MGFFVFVDTKLHSRLESIKTKARILQSFTALIDLMGKSRMTANRTKVNKYIFNLQFVAIIQVIKITITFVDRFTRR
jgi:hypothetical protein